MTAQTPVDYRRARTSALQELAARGDTAAARELQRRGQPGAPADDVTTLDDATLRARVRAWNDGLTAEERARNRERAIAAHEELTIRYRVDTRRWNGEGRAPVPPPTPPWELARGPRVLDWQRPRGSTLYPPDRW